MARSWSREQLAVYADQLLAAARSHASPSHALIHFPGGPGGYGHAVDGLEGFARTFLLAGYRIAGESGNDPMQLADWYAQGLAAGTDPASPERWVGLDEHSQAKVEAACLALILDMTRPWLWDHLDTRVQRNIINYLSPAVGDETYPQTNWVWFRLVVQTFLRSVGGPHNDAEIRADLATHDGFTRQAGWIADGAHRAYDHYAGWALHLFPILWARMSDVTDLAAERREEDVERLDRFLVDAVRLVGGDGGPLFQGRSLTYRFATAAPYWAGIIADVPSTPAPVLRRAASRMVQHFADLGVPAADGVLTGGWLHPWPQLLQFYSGPGSPYWASHGLLGLRLPADHPVWRAPDEPLPVEQDNQLFTIDGPGWLISSTRDDGVVRVFNHGTDQGTEGVPGLDNPLYARFTYSTATTPLLSKADHSGPRDAAVALIHADGRASHRMGFTNLALTTEHSGHATVGVAASGGAVHWAAPDTSATAHTVELPPAGRLTVISLVRGPWEIRLARSEACVAEAVALDMTGWAVGEEDALTSTVLPLSPAGTTEQRRISGASPRHDEVLVPALRFPINDGVWHAALITLAPPTPESPDAEVLCRPGDATVTIQARWPDGHRSTTTVALHPDSAPTPGRKKPKENR